MQKEGYANKALSLVNLFLMELWVHNSETIFCIIEKSKYTVENKSQVSFSLSEKNLTNKKWEKG